MGQSSDQQPEEIDDELLPNEDAAVVARLEAMSPTAIDGDAWVDTGPVSVPDEAAESGGTDEPPKPKRKRLRRKPPANLAEPVLKIPAHLRLISVGRGIANITSTLSFDLDYPPANLAELLGEHAYAAVFDGNYIGNGFLLKDAPLSVDQGDYSVHQKLKGTLPRFDNGVDQVEKYIVPLLPEEVDLSSLMAMSLGWRLNIPVDFPGLLQLHAMQQSFDLTKRADD